MGSNKWNLTKEEYQKLLDESTSISDALRKIGVNPYTGNHRTLHKKIKSLNLSLTALKENYEAWKKEFWSNLSKSKKVSRDSIFVKNGTHSSSSLRRIIVKEKIKSYNCEKCNNSGHWNNEQLTLQLDHIDGDNTNNILENLRFLCPNCHSQTKTYAGKRKRIIKTCDCGTIIRKNSKDCKSCSMKKNISRFKFNPTKEELEKHVLIDKIPFTKIGLIYNVSDNAIRKRCRKLGIEI